MLYVKLVCVGKMKEKYFIDAFQEYRKRLSLYCKFELEELAEQRLPDNPTEREIAAALDRESAAICAAVPAGAQLVAMCIEGVNLSSEELAGQLNRWAVSGVSRLCFVVGGSFGLSAKLKDTAALKLSMSRMTFPHHLARVMLVEQIYRAFSIQEGGKYHK